MIHANWWYILSFLNLFTVGKSILKSNPKQVKKSQLTHGSPEINTNLYLDFNSYKYFIITYETIN
jgi:hypothetical protein